MSHLSNLSWIKLLKDVASGSNIVTDDITLQSFSVQGVKPACVCTPKSEDEAVSIIQFAFSQKVPITPWGSGVHQRIGYPPSKDSLVLNTSGLNRLTYYEPDDMVASVQSGMRLKDLQDTLNARGQWLPLDVSPQRSIGGLIAANMSGPCAFGYGTLRDMVLGMTSIHGDGVRRKCGGRVVKNVTGYDLNKLYVGSFGTLGLITEIAFKLRPLPIARDGWHIPVTNIKEGIEILRKIDSKNLPLEILHLFSRDAFTPPIERQDIPSLDFDSAFHILISAAGTAMELDRIDREVIAVTGLKEIDRFHASVSPKDCWFMNLTSAPTKNSAPCAKLRFWCTRSTLQPALELIHNGNNQPYGLHSFNVIGGTSELLELSEVKVSKILEDLPKLGVSFRFENIKGIKIDQPFGPPRPEWALMKRIKGALDPQGIFNPGRFVVG